MHDVAGIQLEGVERQRRGEDALASAEGGRANAAGSECEGLAAAGADDVFERTAGQAEIVGYARRELHPA